MKIGFVGLGKLGLPVALAVEAAGHTVYGWDESEVVRDHIKRRELPYREEVAQELLDKALLPKILMGPSHIAEFCDLTFIAVQTPPPAAVRGSHSPPRDASRFRLHAPA